MDTELLQALAAEIAEQNQALRLEIRRDHAAQLAEVERAHAEAIARLTERLVEAEHALALERAERVAAFGDPVVGFSRDAAGAVVLLRRSGPPLPLPLPDVPALVEAAVDARLPGVRAEARSEVARTFESFANAPVWSASAVYTAGDIVQTDVGRTWRVRAGVRATFGRVPADDVEHWERLGTGGFRVLKSRPEQLAPGDFFTEHDARFLHDGAQTILFVPKAAKVSDIERAVKGPHGLAQANAAALRDHEQAHASRDAALVADVARSVQAANDASETSVLALAATERVEQRCEALERRIEALVSSSGGA